jgi:hypothetical protein
MGEDGIYGSYITNQSPLCDIQSLHAFSPDLWTYLQWLQPIVVVVTDLSLSMLGTG